MEREVSSAAMLGVSLIALAAFLSIVVYTIYIGNILRDDIANTAADTLEIVKTGQLHSLLYEKNVMPSSAAYTLTQENSSAIVASVCGICSTDSNCLIAHPDEIDNTKDFCNKCKKSLNAGIAGDCIKGHLSGKVSVQVLENNNSTYYVVIHRENCNWHIADDKMGCTCDDGNVNSEIETVYDAWLKTRMV